MTTDEQLTHLKKFCQRGEEKSFSDAIACGGTEWLRDWLKENLPFIIDLEDTPSGHEAAQVWDSKAKEMMADRGLKTPHQQKNRFTDIRNAIRTIDPDHPALADIGFTTEEWLEINRPTESAVSTHVTKFITDPEAVVNIAIELLNSRDWFDLAVALAVLTGRRCAEVLKTAEFSYVTPYSVWFVGAVKRGTEEVQPEFEIPTLAPASDIIATINKLRQWVDTTGMDNRQINRNYSKRLGEISDRHFKGLVPPREGRDNLYTHIFRAVYATIASHWYCPPSLPVLEFRAYIQGHFKTIKDLTEERLRTLASQRHYLDYAIGDGNGNVDGRLGIKLNMPGVEVISVFKSYYKPFLQVKAIVTPEPHLIAEEVNPTRIEGNEDTQQEHPTSTGVEENQEMAQTPIKQRGQTLPNHRVTSTSTRDPSTPLTNPMASSPQQADKADEPKQDSPQALQQTITSMLRSSSYTVVLTALMAATGRSPGELLKSKIIETNPDNPFSVFERYTVDNQTVVLPTLVEGTAIIKAIAKLKKHRSAKDLLYLAPKDIDLHCLAQIEQRHVIPKYFSCKSVEQLYQAYSTAIQQRASLPPTPTATQSPTSKKTNQKKPGTAKSETGRTAKGKAGRTPKGKAQDTQTTSKKKTPQFEAVTLIESWGKVALQLKERFGLSQPEQLLEWVEQHWAATTETQESARQETSQDPQVNTATPDVTPTNDEPGNSPDDGDTSESEEINPNVKSAAVEEEKSSPFDDTPIAIETTQNVTQKKVEETKPPIPPAASIEKLGKDEGISKVEEMFIFTSSSINQLTEAIGQLVTLLSHQTISLPHPSPTQPTTTPVNTESTSNKSRRTLQETKQNSTEKKSSSPAVKPKNSASLEKINRAIDAIIDLNNSATTKKDKWLVSLSALKQLTKCGQDTIARVLEQRASEIDNHHELHELGKFHNNKGKFAPGIIEVIQL